MEHGGASNDSLEVYRSQAKQILKKLNSRSTSKMSIESNPYIFHYIIDQGICYLSMCHKAYPKRLAFLFLEEISKEFETELRNDNGDNWLRTVETVGRQYAFIKFGKY